jgi:hypothetical protein
MNDSDIQQALRRRMPAGEPPSFDATWHAAELRYRRGRRRNAALAGLAATVAAAVIVVNLLMPGPEQVAYIELAELLETTSWQAPSDTLMPERQFDIYQELPVLIESTEEAGGALL